MAMDTGVIVPVIVPSVTGEAFNADSTADAISSYVVNPARFVQPAPVPKQAVNVTPLSGTL